MNVIRFTIPGKPNAWQRSGQNGKFHFTPKETVQFQNCVKLFFCQAAPDWQPHEGPVTMDVRSFFEVPKSWSAKKRAATIGRPVMCSKPDWDNLGKNISDALNGIAYRDDAQVYDGRVSKQYTDGAPRTEVIIIFEDAA